jgi:hypothetical protein
MTKLLVVMAAAGAAALAFALASHSSATASTAGDPRIAVLQRQVKALQVQVKTLAATLVKQNGQINVNFTADTCLAAQTADLIQGTWGVIDQVAQGTQQKTYFGPQTQVNDYGNCSQLTSPDVPRGPVAVPPKIDPLLPLLQWLHE